MTFRLHQKFGKCAVRAKNPDVYSVWDLLLKRSLNGKGWSQMTREFPRCWCIEDDNILNQTLCAWPKSAAALGIGTDNEIDLYVDADARMDMQKLDEALASVWKTAIRCC